MVDDNETVVLEADDSDAKAHCGVCKAECENGQEALGCDLCDKWFHRECLKYTKGTYKAIIQVDEVKWFCKECNAKCKDTLSMIQLVMQRIDVLDGRNSASEKKHAALEKRVLRLEQELEKERSITPTQNNNEAPQISLQQQQAAGESNAGNLTKIISAELREIKEVEERKSNLIITEIPEEGGTSEEGERKLTAIGVVEGDDTKKVVEKIFVKLGVNENIEIVEAKRIPQRIAGQDGNNTRKVLVKLTNPKMQKIILEKAREMKRLGNGWEKSYISPDLTKKQREKAYQLRVEKRRRTEAGEMNLIIRNGAVVVKQQQNNPPPFQPGRDQSAES